MLNQKPLVALSLLRKILETFSNFFLSIYLFKLVDGDFNFLLAYAAFGAVSGCIFGYFLMKHLRATNANQIFRLSFACEIVSMLMLLVLQAQIMQIIWLFAAIQRFASMAYYAVYEVTLIRSAKRQNLSSYIAGVQILGSIITLLAPVVLGYIITESSWLLAFIFMLIDTILAAFIATKVNFRVLYDGFNPTRYWRIAVRRKNLRRAYITLLLKRLSGDDGVLQYLIPVLLFLALGTEFSAGSYNSLFSIVYIILLEVVRIFNKRHLAKKFYAPLALFVFASAAVMLADFNTSSVLLFYFAFKTGGKLLMTEGSSMIYSIGNQEGLAKYTREHQFTWNIFLAIGNLAGILIAYIVYNNFYSQTALANVMLILMIFFVAYAYGLQKLATRPGRA